MNKTGKFALAAGLGVALAAMSAGPAAAFDGNDHGVRKPVHRVQDHECTNVLKVHEPTRVRDRKGPPVIVIQVIVCGNGSDNDNSPGDHRDHRDHGVGNNAVDNNPVADDNVGNGIGNGIDNGNGNSYRP